MSQSLETVILAQIKHFAALTPTQLRDNAFTTHSDIRRTHEHLVAACPLSADELARGRMTYLDFFGAVSAKVRDPERYIATEDELVMCAMAGAVTRSHEAKVMSHAYQEQNWERFFDSLSNMTHHYEAQAQLYSMLSKVDYPAENLAHLRNCVAVNAGNVAYFRLLCVLDAPVEVIKAVWGNASAQSREMFASSLKRLIKARSDADVSRVIKEVLKDVKPASQAKVKLQDNALPSQLDDSLKAIVDELINFEISKLQKFDSEVHNAIHVAHQRIVGRRDPLLISFTKAELGGHYKRFTAKLKAGSTDFSGIDLAKAALLSSIEQVEATYRLSQAYEARDWRAFCSESGDVSQNLRHMMALFTVKAQLQPDNKVVNKTILEELDLAIYRGESCNKFFQLHMVLEAPAEAVKHVWSRERKEDIATYSSMLKQLADARGDADVSKVVNELIAAAAPAKKSKPKMPRAPKK